MTDNAFATINAVAFLRTFAELGSRHVRMRPRWPQANGVAEWFKRTLPKEWA